MYCQRKIVKNIRERHPNKKCDIYEGFLISVIDCIYYDIHHISSSLFDEKMPQKLNKAEHKKAENIFYTILNNFKISWQRDKEIIENVKKNNEGVFGRFKSFFKKTLPQEEILKEFRLSEPNNTKVSWREMENFNSIFESELMYQRKSFKQAINDLKYRAPVKQTKKPKPTRYDYLDEYIQAIFNYLEVLNVKSKFEEIQTTSIMPKDELLRLPIRAMMEVDSWDNRNEVMSVLNRIVQEKRMEESFIEEIIKTGIS